MGLMDNIQSWRNYRRTVRHLSQLPDRELHDMGIARWRVRDVAAGHGYDRNEVR